MRKSHTPLAKLVVGSMAVLVAVPWAGQLPLVQTSHASAAGTIENGILMLENFEAGSAGVVRLNPKRVVSASASIETDPQHVRNGTYSLRIDYDMIDVVDNPSQLELYPASGNIAIAGKPIKVGMWVYGNNDGHLLTTKFRDSGGSSFTPEYYEDETIGVNWTGWKYIEVEVPQNKIEGSSLELLFQLKQSDMAKKNKGSIWIDDVQLIYEDTGADHEVPAIEAVSPAPNDVVPSDVTSFEVRIRDVQSGTDTVSGIDPASIRLIADGQDLTSHATYSEETELLSLPSEFVTSGYHEVVVNAKDRAGNPARLGYSFTEAAGERLTMSAPAEAVSNELYEVTVSLAGDRTSASSQVTLQYDPSTLTVEQIVPKNGTSISSRTDAAGQLQFGIDGIASSGELATVQFRVSSDAVLARGESFKQVKMTAGTLASEAGSISSLAVPVHYTIAFPYLMDIEGVGLKTTTTFKVTTHDGVPAAGADVYLRGLLGEMAVATITADTPVYEDDDTSEPVLTTLHAGDRIYSAPESDDGWYEVLLADGATTGYIEEANVDAASLIPLNRSLGQTDENGILKTDLTTLALGTYKAQAVVGSKNSAAVSFEVVEPYGNEYPEYVQTYITEDLSSQMSIGWMTSPHVSSNYVQYVKAEDWGSDEAAPDESKVTTTRAQGENQVLSELENGTKGEIRFHTALIGGLDESTAYKYRVGDAGAWSEWYDYSTTDASLETPVSFVFVTDSHVKADNGMETYQALIDNALANYPDTQFLMHGGDAVDAGGAFAEWKRFWQATSSYSNFLPSATTLGNHDVKAEGKEVYAKGAILPDNGPAAYKEYAYSYDLDDTHFVVLNSEGTTEQMAMQAQWLEQDLNSNDKKWTIAMFHRPVYHTEAGRGDLAEDVKIYFSSILENHNVDLVLVGHDHVYARTYRMAGGVPSSDGKGSIYLDGGSSGWKFYDGEKYSYLEFMYDDDVPVYSHVTVSDSEIKVDARTLEGELIDTFSIAKQETSGGSNGGNNGGNNGSDNGSNGGDNSGNSDSSGTTEPADTVHELTAKELEAAGANGELTLAVSGQVNQLKIGADVLKQLQSGGSIATLVVKADGLPAIRIAAGQLTAPADGSDLVLGWKTEDFGNSSALSSLASGPNAQATSRLAFNVSSNVGGIVYALDWSGLALTPYTHLYRVTESGKPELVSFSIVNQKQQAQLVPNATYVAVEVQSGYADLSASHWSYSYLQMLSGIGVIQGTGDNKVSAEKQVTRAEFTAMLARALGLNALSSSGFADVVSNAWYADSVSAAAAAGIVLGDRDGRFQPNAEISRQEMAVMLLRALEYRGAAAAGSGSGSAGGSDGSGFGDEAAIAAWARDAARQLKQLGLMEGNEAGDFSPLASATRAETAKVVAMLLCQ
ncbi:S-layer homology domain-containing protein [Cohnella fermenti]|uniref:S-layer homology domain-containing protein n=1 Tax=Cohnella fermenti TaxID=2565925 RepID=UPI001454DC0B|nr:S-layer homology domain-containing protein [Cohnella fermenti]